jgi:hypothetical protein
VPSVCIPQDAKRETFRRCGGQRPRAAAHRKRPNRRAVTLLQMRCFDIPAGRPPVLSRCLWRLRPLVSSVPH